MRRLCLLGLIGWVFSTPAMAQIKPDGSVGTQVTPNVLIQGIMNDGTLLKGASSFGSNTQIDRSNRLYLSVECG